MADEEVPVGVGEPPAMSTVADLVLMLDDSVDDGSPYFHNAKYAPPNTLLAAAILVLKLTPNQNFFFGVAPGGEGNASALLPSL